MLLFYIPSGAIMHLLLYYMKFQQAFIHVYFRNYLNGLDDPFANL